MGHGQSPETELRMEYLKSARIPVGFSRSSCRREVGDEVK